MASGARASNLPPGYRFCPDDDDLIVHYLKKKILGQQLPADFIPTTDVFASSPDKLPLDDFKWGVANEWFFFSTRSKDDDVILTENGYYATDPEGTDPIRWMNRIVGYVKTLNFYQGSPPKGTETDWMVEEFSVNPEFVPVNKDDHITQEKPTLLYAKFLEDSLNRHGMSSSSKKKKQRSTREEIWNPSKLVKGRLSN